VPLLEPSLRAGLDERRSLERGRLRVLRSPAWSEPSWLPRSSRRGLRRLRQVPLESALLLGPRAPVQLVARQEQPESLVLLAQASWVALVRQVARLRESVGLPVQVPRAAWPVRLLEQEWSAPVQREPQAVLPGLVRQRFAPEAVLPRVALSVP
jgi:hypothetical protein